MLSGRGYKTRLLNLHDEWWDRRLGISTFGYRPEVGTSGSATWRVHYTPASYSGIFAALASVGLSSEDNFTDLGSGMGRAVFAASWCGAGTARGVEILPELCEIAETNRHRSKLSKRDIGFVCDDATTVDLAGTTVLFMFHPFGPGTLTHVLDNIERKRSKGLRIVYMNPVFNASLQERDWLHLDRIITPRKSLFAKTQNWDIAIWRAED
jgi:predicted RNA methylase